MAKYTSRFPELGFYVDGELRKFYVGEYATEDEKEIAALENIADAHRVDEPKAEEAPKAKPKAPKKSSGK